jgi:hypothetical protein
MASGSEKRAERSVFSDCLIRVGLLGGVIAMMCSAGPAVASAAGTPVPSGKLQLASPNVTWLDGPTTGSSPSCASSPAGSPEPSTVALSADASSDALITFESGSQGPPAFFVSNPYPVDQISGEQLEFEMSGSGTLKNGSSASFTDTFDGYGTSFAGTLDEVLMGSGGGTCEWTTPTTLTFAGTGLTLVSTPTPGPSPAASATSVVCNYQFQQSLDVCSATVGSPSGTPSGQVHFSSDTPGVFVSGNPCTLTPTPLSSASSCTVEFKPASNSLTVITSLVMHATYRGDSRHLPSSGKSRSAIQLPNSGNLRTTISMEIGPVLGDGGINLQFDNPDPNGTIDIKVAESGSLATGGAARANLSRQLKGKPILARLHRKLKATGPIDLHAALTAKGRKQLKLLKHQHKQIEVTLLLTYIRP